MKQKKGSAFEREICVLLSKWWTNNQRDDIFWRTAGSGARAKARSKKNKSTFGQYGDIQAIDPIGQPLINLCTIEIKRGYSKHTIMDLIDKEQTAAEQKFETFIHQAITDQICAKTYSWLLITRRDRHKALMVFPYFLYQRLEEKGSRINRAKPCLRLRYKEENRETRDVFVTTFVQFLKRVKPFDIKSALARSSKWKN